jgi:DUF438 domain-containing protein
MAKKPTARNGTDAIAMLKADHDKVKKLFKKFEELHEDEANDEAEQVATQICNELTVHTKIEEEIFYPALREAIDDEDLLNEAEVEHASCKDLIAQIRKMSADDEMYAAKVIVLGEYIDHHVEEEHAEMFPKAKKAKKLDLKALGERMATRKSALMSSMGMEAEEGEDKPLRRSARRSIGGSVRPARA